MALILRSTIPRALITFSERQSNNVRYNIPIPTPDEKYEEYCTTILESGANKPHTNDGFVYTTKNIHELVEKMQNDYKMESCKDCGCGSC